VHPTSNVDIEQLNLSIPFYTIAERLMILVICNAVNETDPNQKVYIFWISITRRVDLAMCVCTSVNPFYVLLFVRPHEF